MHEEISQTALEAANWWASHLQAPSLEHIRTLRPEIQTEEQRQQLIEELKFPAESVVGDFRDRLADVIDAELVRLGDPLLSVHVYYDRGNGPLINTAIGEEMRGLCREMFPDQASMNVWQEQIQVSGAGVTSGIIYSRKS